MPRTPKSNSKLNSSIKFCKDDDITTLVEKFDGLKFDEPIFGRETLKTIKIMLNCLIDGGEQFHALITGPADVASVDKNTRQKLRLIFDQARQSQYSLIFIDELDYICNENRNEDLTGLLRYEISKSRNHPVLVLGATNEPELLNKKIRSPSYLNEEIRLRYPNFEERLSYLTSWINKNTDWKLEEEQLSKIGRDSNFYSFKELRKMCFKVKANKSEPIEGLSKFINVYKPYGHQAVITSLDKVRWEEIGGVQQVKEKLIRYVVWPIKKKEMFIKKGKAPSKGCLLYGPPGCSKTMLAKAIATESNYNFLMVKGPELKFKYHGETEARLRNTYRQAQDIAPCIIFFDEIDTFATNRKKHDATSSVGEGVIGTFLTTLDAIKPFDSVYTILATNYPHRIDESLLRSGRIEDHIYIPLPDEIDRREILKVSLRNCPISFNLDETCNILAAKTQGYSGAEIRKLCDEAKNLDKEVLDEIDLEESLKIVKPKTTTQMIKMCERFENSAAFK